MRYWQQEGGKNVSVAGRGLLGRTVRRRKILRSCYVNVRQYLLCVMFVMLRYNHVMCMLSWVYAYVILCYVNVSVGYICYMLCFICYIRLWVRYVYA